MAELAYLSLQETNLQVIAVVDDERTGENFCGHKVEPFLALTGLAYDRVILTVVGTEPTAENRARADLVAEGVSNHDIVGLLQ
jgi:hypothetical protein